MKILILGAKGMLGHALMKEWGEINPIGLDRDELDIVDKEAVFATINKIKPQIIINCAAYTDVDKAEQEEREAFKINKEGTKNIAKAALQRGAIFVHYSTDYVFEGKKRKGYKENDVSKSPVNNYGASKLAGEKEILKLKTGNSKLHYYLIRTSWLFGPSGKNFVQTIINLSANNSQINIVNDQWGKPTYTIDLAKATRELIEDKPPFGIYHLVNEPETSWYGFASEIIKLLPGIHTKVIPISSVNFPRPAKRPHYSVLLNTKRPLLRPWEEALAEYMNNWAV